MTQKYGRDTRIDFIGRKHLSQYMLMVLPWRKLKFDNLLQVIPLGQYSDQQTGRRFFLLPSFHIPHYLRSVECEINVGMFILLLIIDRFFLYTVRTVESSILWCSKLWQIAMDTHCNHGNWMHHKHRNRRRCTLSWSLEMRGCGCTWTITSGQTVPFQQKYHIPSQTHYIFTNPLPLCSPCQMPSNEPFFTHLPPLLTEFAYLYMFFIFQ